MTKQILMIGTRKSKLAVYQANLVATLLNKLGHSAELVKITTSGDKFVKDSLAEIGGKGLFIKEIEEALIRKEIDIAVHSLKDMPAGLQEGLSLSAFLKRDDARDAWISPRFGNCKAVKQLIVVGTTSLRRQYQLKLLNRNIEFEILRGNVDTRLRKLDEGQYDAIVLSCAGIQRLKIKREDMVPLTPDDTVPAVGQGCIVIETRADDFRTNKIVASLNDKITEECVLLERELQEFTGGNCFIPFGAYFEKKDSTVVARTFLHIDEKTDFIKIKDSDDWSNRISVMERIKSQLEKYLNI